MENVIENYNAHVECWYKYVNPVSIMSMSYMRFGYNCAYMLLVYTHLTVFDAFKWYFQQQKSMKGIEFIVSLPGGWVVGRFSRLAKRMVKDWEGRQRYTDGAKANAKAWTCYQCG